MTRVGILGAPRPIPAQRWLAPVGAAVAIALALPVFLLADWPLSGWAIAAVLWVGGEAFALLLARIRPSADNIAGSGILAFAMMFRLLAVLVVLLLAAAKDGDVGLAAALVYGLAYSVELLLSLVGYYSQEPTA